MTDMGDELLERVVGELRTLPPVDDAAVRRIVRAAAADVPGVRGAPPLHGARFAARVRSWWQPRIPLAAAAGLALAAGLTGYAVRGAESPAPTAVTTPAPTGPVTRLVSAERALPASDRAVPTQFVLDSPRAARVSLVGDFNGWDPAATPLVRDPSSGIWTATVPLLPGRHVYAFMVDDTVWTIDPRAPSAQDPDFGTPSSVVLVGTP